MAPSISGSDQFSACSISIMEPAIASAACIAPRTSIDVAIDESGVAEAILFGQTATLRYDVLNVGSAAADDVTATIPLLGDALVSITAIGGTCSGGADAAQCSFGRILPSGGRTITLEVIPGRIGSVGYEATVTATADEVPDNDTATARVTVEPVAEVGVTAPGATVIVNRRVTLAPTVTNAGAQAADQVTVTITPGAGLRVDSVRWPQGVCATVDNIVTCDAGSLSVTSSQISVDVTGVSVGDKSYAVEVTSVTADTNLVNNSATGTVRVNATAPTSGGDTGGGGGGGGALGWPWLLALMAGVAGRRLRRPAAARRMH